MKELFGDDDSNDEEDYKLLLHKNFHLSKLAAPFKDTERGWNNELAVDQATLHLNFLGYGKGGNKSLVDTVGKKTEWWDDDNNFDKYIQPSKAKMNVSEDVIESILKHYG